VTVLVLGDGLVRSAGPVARRPDEPVLVIEAREFARRRPYHPHKLVLVFAAMRHFRDDLREAGRTVSYHQVETFGDGFDRHFQAHPGDDLVAMDPAGYRAGDRLRELVRQRGGTLELVPDERFCCGPEAFDRWADGADRLRHEDFYRHRRRETGYLMEDGDPVGGEFNFDDRNRDPAPPDYDPPDPPRYNPDEVTREVVEWVDEAFAGGYAEPPYGGDWADPEPFRWPVTRADALDALDRFCEQRLASFGPYQDAMVDGEWSMHHSLLSAAMNVGLLRPGEVIERAIDAARERSGGDLVGVATPEDGVPIHSLEGFVRQVLGWREFLRHVYRREMPDLARANRLGDRLELPECYWTGDTDMACLADVVDGVRERGYSHHIQRLMILANFALLYGVEPRRLNRWFHAAYVDAYHWVTTPNVVEMGLYAHGAFATKPYAASANYVDGMSDYCGGCFYDPDATTGRRACPFNALYWEFLDRHGDRLRSNHRMGLVYSHLEDKTERELAAIRERAAEVRTLARDGEL
jgi:deoxyribodipyrimidine photolyase-related protein